MQIITGKVWTVLLHHNRDLRYMSVMASQFTDNSIVLQQFIQSNNKGNHQRSAKLAVCEGNPPVTSGFPSQMASHVGSIFHVMTLPG